MITFKSISYKNFLSSGDKFTKILLNKSPSTLVVGKNGAGKSTMTDALSFALFGKAHRNITKPQLVNSINQKHCIVEVEFDVNGSQYKVVRGIKPARFEIYVNGTMINQESNARDYQKHLELNILKMNHKSFHQIVVLGSSSFIPFMQLPAHHRREVIEDLLDINIFSKMNMIVKEKISKNRDQIKDLEFQIELIKEKILTQQQYIDDITKLNKSKSDDIKKEIKEAEVEMNSLIKENEDLSKQTDGVRQKLTNDLAKLKALEIEGNRHESNFKTKIKEIVKRSQFYENNTVCNECEQEINHEIKTKKIGEFKEKAKELSGHIESVNIELNKYATKISQIEDKINMLNKHERVIEQNTNSINLWSKTIVKKSEMLSEMNDVSSEFIKAKEILDDRKQQHLTLVNDKLSLTEKQHYLNICSEMLKDTGIKTKIIKEYLPVMNNIVNKYLQILDFFVDFNIDENFQETVRSRYRDEFSYSSFSEGEKMKIDLSLLFAWRYIAKMKNSAATNLLILDETFDSSLDQEGVENLTKIMYSLEENTNTFVISHKGDILDGKFMSRIEFVKEKNFSVIKA